MRDAAGASATINGDVEDLNSFIDNAGGGRDAPLMLGVNARR
ncbi:hypothetical protein [Lujinxingia litoralis]|nr:hypothetical protein [Lujinxingia litoralis]